VITPAWFLVGSATWSAAEYAIHRWIGHGPKRPEPSSFVGRFTPAGLAYEFRREHLAHHADPSYFAPTSRKVLAAGVVMPLAALALTPILGVRRAASFVGGFALAYGTYEVLHRRIHTHPARGSYGRWRRRHHLFHHHKTPRANHGVTTPLWDIVFQTWKPNDETNPLRPRTRN
jgi:4-hydroxysphinganine ceramide fatty acyl 2-hydroxylase